VRGAPVSAGGRSGSGNVRQSIEDEWDGSDAEDRGRG
jgi:hypothetical protein